MEASTGEDLSSLHVADDVYVKMSARVENVREVFLAMKDKLLYEERTNMEREGGDGFRFGAYARFLVCIHYRHLVCVLMFDDFAPFEAVLKTLEEWNSPDVYRDVGRVLIDCAASFKKQRETLREAYRDRVRTHAEARGDAVAEEFMRRTDTYRGYVIDAEHEGCYTMAELVDDLEKIGYALLRDKYGLIYMQFAALRKRMNELRPELVKERGREWSHFRSIVDEVRP